MKVKLTIITLIIANISNLYGMKTIEHLKERFYASTQSHLDRYDETIKELITKNPIKPTANTVEAHTCNVIQQLSNELYHKNMTPKNIKSCQINIDEKKKSDLYKMIKHKYPEIYDKTVISYVTPLAENCHATLDALIQHNNIIKADLSKARL